MTKILTKPDRHSVNTFFVVHFPLLLICILAPVISWLSGWNVASAIATSIYVLAFRWLVIGLLRLKEYLNSSRRLTVSKSDSDF